MSLEILRKQITADTKAEAERIVDEAEKKSISIIKQAENQAKQLVSGEQKSAESIALAEKAETIAAAKLEAKRIVDEAKETKAEEALSLVWEEFSKHRNEKNYAKTLKSLIEAGKKSIGSGFVVMVNEADMQQAKETAKKAKVKKTDITAGAIVASLDEKIIANNSLEAVFEEKKDTIKAEIFQEMFPEKKEQKTKNFGVEKKTKRNNE